MNLLDTLFQYFYTTSIMYKSLRLKPKQKICFRLITEVCEMHLGVYNDWLQTQHNAKMRSAQVCHVNFPSTLQNTVIWAAFKMATTFFCCASIHYLLMMPRKHFNWIVMACLGPLILLPFKTSIVQDSPSCATERLTLGKSS